MGPNEVWSITEVLFISECATECSESTYNFFGLRNGNECWCTTHDFNVDDVNHDPGVCDISCQGYGHNEICGGIDSMNVYEFEFVQEPFGIANDDGEEETEYELIECVLYSDMELFEYGDYMTIGDCANICPKFFGLQNGNECWFTDEFILDAIKETNDPGVCDMPCLGNPEQTCGGVDSMNVYGRPN